MCIRDSHKAFKRFVALEIKQSEENTAGDQDNSKIIAREPVSYTHLDVYKRQTPYSTKKICLV